MKKVFSVLFVLVFCFVATNAFADGGAPAAGQPAVTQAKTVQAAASGVAVGVKSVIVVKPADVTVVQPGEVKTEITKPVTVQTADGAPLVVDGRTLVRTDGESFPIVVKEVPENPSWCVRNLGWCALGIGVLAGGTALALDAAGAFDREVSFK